MVGSTFLCRQVRRKNGVQDCRDDRFSRECGIPLPASLRSFALDDLCCRILRNESRFTWRTFLLPIAVVQKVIVRTLVGPSKRVHGTRSCCRNYNCRRVLRRLCTQLWCRKKLRSSCLALVLIEQRRNKKAIVKWLRLPFNELRL